MATTATSKCLAFLLCDRASKGRDGKVALHGLFDRIIMPRTRGDVDVFFVFYKVVVGEPCKLELRILDPLHRQVPGPWSDNISDAGLLQTVWALTTSQFERPGKYILELREVLLDSNETTLATTELAVDEPSE
ncbi:MAG: DUF6941 family protein [Terriglobia bacterium]